MTETQIAAVEHYQFAVAGYVAGTGTDLDVDRARHELLALGLSIEDVDEIETI